MREHMRSDAVTLATRVVYFALLVFGGFIALGFATDSQNVTVIGVIGATVVASLGLQDILRNYVSGFYILFERNLKVGAKEAGIDRGRRKHQQRCDHAQREANREGGQHRVTGARR